MKLAFSTVACPDWTLDQVVDQASALGYDGVELRTLGPGGSGLSCDPALSDPAKVRSAFERAGVEPVCLSTSAALHHRDSTTIHRVRRQLLEDMKTAAQIGCAQVRVFGNQVQAGRDRQAAIQHISTVVLPLLDTAAEVGVQLLFENAGSFNRAKEWWWLFNLVDHPMLGLCWNVANAAAAGEPPSVSVPCLNSRIRLGKVKDTHVGEGSGFVPLGDGTVGVEQFIKRLAGIGFDGFVTVEWDRVWLPALAPAEEYLPDALKRLRGWLEAIDGSKAKGFSDSAPMNKELKKILDAAAKAKAEAQEAKTVAAAE